MNRDRGPNSAKLGPCWPVFALGRVFSRLWRLLCVSWTRLAPLGRFLGVFDRLGLVVGMFWDTPWMFWKPKALFGLKRPWPHFFRFFCTTCVMSILGVLGASWLGFGELWGSFRYHFRRRCANCCRDPSMAFTLAFRYLLAARQYVRSTWNLERSLPFWPPKISAPALLDPLKLHIF